MAPHPDRKPEITELIRASGHRTLRVIFMDQRTEEEQVVHLKQLNHMHASFEGGTPGCFAIDVEPEGDYGAVCDQLSAWETSGILEYETCEAQFLNSFDAAPEVED